MELKEKLSIECYQYLADIALAVAEQVKKINTINNLSEMLLNVVDVCSQSRKKCYPRIESNRLAYDSYFPLSLTSADDITAWIYADLVDFLETACDSDSSYFVRIGYKDYDIVEDGKLVSQLEELEKFIKQ